MRPTIIIALLALTTLAILTSCSTTAPTTGSLAFDIAFPDTLGTGPVDGRLLVIMSTDPEMDPLWGPYPDAPLTARQETDWRPGQTRHFDGQDRTVPVSLDSIAPGTYQVRAILDTNQVDFGFGYAPGNLLSEKQEVTVVAGEEQTVELPLIKLVPQRKFNETDRIQEEQIRSHLVSTFTNKDRRLSAAVVLPASYGQDPDRRYPTVYVIPGWGSGRHDLMWGDFQQERYGMDGMGREKVFVFLDHALPEGYHCFADSDNLGPWGQALVEEFIPYLEERYQLINDPEARLLAGQSSGGWGVVWLMLNYTEHFGGAWSASPDFVDFRLFGGSLNIYEQGANVFLTADGEPRRSSRHGDDTVREAIQRELMTGDGGQIAAFEAVYGPRGEDGEPRPLFDRQTGAVDPEVALAWARYDLGLTLKKAWPEVGDYLAGRLHIVMSHDDPWLLDEPLELLEPELEHLGIDVDIRFIDRATHNTWSDEIRVWVHEGMDGQLEASGLLQ